MGTLTDFCIKIKKENVSPFLHATRHLHEMTRCGSAGDSCNKVKQKLPILLPPHIHTHTHTHIHIHTHTHTQGDSKPLRQTLSVDRANNKEHFLLNNLCLLTSGFKANTGALL